MNEITKINEEKRRRRFFFLLSALAATVLGSLILLIADNDDDDLFLRNNNDSYYHNEGHGRQLESDPKSVILRTDSPSELIDDDLKARRKNCQVVYLMGVEGATHHGFLPIIEALANSQVDPSTDQHYRVDMKPKFLKSAVYGWGAGKRLAGRTKIPAIDDDSMIRRAVQRSCPDDGEKHVLVEWQSFPSGHEDDPRSYRVHRQHDWLSMTPAQIADSPLANQNPANMTAFVRAYSPYMDIKFVVLHRPFLETIASHDKWDGGPEVHSNIIRGFMLILSRFLKANPFDLVDGSRMWNLLCVERIMAKNYDTEKDALVARTHVLANMAEFLGWPVKECEHCFDNWYESKKDPEQVLGEEKTVMLREHMELLDGVWPPPGEEGVAEQQCGL